MSLNWSPSQPISSRLVTSTRARRSPLDIRLAWSASSLIGRDMRRLCSTLSSTPSKMAPRPTVNKLRRLRLTSRCLASSAAASSRWCDRRL